MRKNILEILNSADIDIEKEYSRIYSMFYYPYEYGGTPLASVVEKNFRKLDRRLIHRCLSLADFNETYGYYFEVQPQNFDIDYLISFSEYVANFVYALFRGNILNREELVKVMGHIKECMEDIGYQHIEKDAIIIFVEKNPAAIAVAEMTKADLAYSVLEYNHHKLKGDLISKKNILKNMADDIESDRKMLNNINKKFTENLFQLMNKFVRHDSSQNAYISNMTSSSLEEAYDDIYQMWLLAKMQLEYSNRSKIIDELIKNINI